MGGGGVSFYSLVIFETFLLDELIIDGNIFNILEKGYFDT